VPVATVTTRPRGYGDQIRAVKALCRTFHPDVLHTHGYLADVIGLASVRCETTSLVSTVHGFIGGGWKNRVYERIQCWSYGHGFSAVVAVSRQLRADLSARGVKAGVLRTVPNGWPVGQHYMPTLEARCGLEIPRDAFSIGWIGRISREKGLDILLQAVDLLRAGNWHLTIVGDGPERARLQKESEQQSNWPRTSWRGAIPEAGRLIRGFDLVVMSSRTEGTPMVLFESMDAGVPIVATAVGGIPDVLSSREGLLVPANNPAALAEAIRVTMANPSTAAERATRAHKLLDSRFAMDPWLDEYDRVYQAICPSRRVGWRG
jgi:glycosyltransferase involved in cell wall biosynthesis